MASEYSNTNPFVTDDDSGTRGVQQNHLYSPSSQSPPNVNIYGEYQHITFPTPHIPGPYTSPNEQNNVPLYPVDTFKNNKYNINNPPAAYIPENNFDSYSSNAYAGGGLNVPNSSDSSSDEDDNTENITNSVAANPGIEASDPKKLNPLTPEMISKKSTPDGANKIAIIFTYIVSCVSILVSLFFLILYCSRRWFKKNKIQRWLLLIIDLTLGISFGCLMVFLIKGFSCKPGSENGWCDFYNTSIFFNVLCFVLYAISFIWDILGSFDMFIKAKK
ncbi:1921_t:CDS:2 [Diversispora eburnea]|uniref:1921_t:CDS:1 n=1 Tax=Diversispora eburnea TaxID=1213867 RepID=A0A9N8ZUQ1_9GLOM|nr:1921_t:CDS:2 [Diversispora eburnea]